MTRSSPWGPLDPVASRSGSVSGCGCRVAGGGRDVVHTFEIGLSRATDTMLLEVARQQNRTVVTLDADFHALLAVANANSPSVIRIRQEGLCGNSLAALLMRIWPKIARQIDMGALVTVTETALRIRHLPLDKSTE